MPRSPKSLRRAPERACLYDDITDRIIAELEAGRLPWVQPWGASDAAAPLGLPRNAATGRSYSGINILILWGAVVTRGFSSQSWLTFRQALGLGGHVRMGERGTTIVYADRFVPRDAEPGDDESRRSIPFLKRFTVFSVDQCEGLPVDIAASPPPLPEGLILPAVEALIETSGADLRTGGSEAFYAPALDIVQVPRPEAFFVAVDWHRTALHELGHWTGHPSRLGRDQSGRFGSDSYAREELVAELCAAFCCASLGITPTVRHADYIGGWLDVLRADKRAVVRAASAASKAADYLLAFAPGTNAGAESPDSSARPALSEGEDVGDLVTG